MIKNMQGRLLIFIIFFSMLFLTAISCHALGIKENSIIKGNTIKLGDIFYGLTRDEDRIIGNAPQPGKDMVLNARTLLRIARALNLPWRPSSIDDKVILRRDATIIKYDKIKEAIYTALYDEGIYGDYEISIPAHYQQIILPANEPANLSVTNINIGSNRNIFEITLVAPSVEKPIQQVKLKGQIEQVIHVPVLKNNIENGRIIRPSDIETITIKEKNFSKGIIVDANKLIGMTAKRILIAGRPIKEMEIIAPQMIERGAIITLSLNNGMMNISTKVKALENGAKGDVIRVVNLSSNKSLQAIVTGNNKVSTINAN